MNLMSKISKKISSVILLSSLLLILGGFCNALIASASVQQYTPSIQEVVVSSDNIVDCSSENNAVDDNEKVVEKAKPINNTLMPCCVERKNNSDTLIPAALQDRVKFAPSMMTEQVILADNAVEQKIYPSSPSPPHEAENISCTVKLE